MAVAVPEKRTYATMLSFVGITRRSMAWMRRNKTAGAARGVLWAGLSIYLLVMYTVVLTWYALIIGFFFIVIPWRVIRRGQRKSLHIQQQQLAALQGMQKPNP